MSHCYDVIASRPRVNSGIDDSSDESLTNVINAYPGSILHSSLMSHISKWWRHRYNNDDVICNMISLFCLSPSYSFTLYNYLDDVITTWMSHTLIEWVIPPLYWSFFINYELWRHRWLILIIIDWRHHKWVITNYWWRHNSLKPINQLKNQLKIILHNSVTWWVIQNLKKNLMTSSND